MSYSFNKGFEHAKNGYDPELPKLDNSISDYIFQTYDSRENREKAREDYIKGYEAAVSQINNSNNKK
jgi:hypothetical protein